jgi:cytochrome c553
MCHTEKGNDPTLAFVPRLAAQNAGYVEEQLKAFRDGSRADPPAAMYMWPMVQNLNDDQIKEAATWFSSQPAPAPFPPDAAAEEGRKIYTQGLLSANVPACASCHGPKADGTGIFPRLAGQNPQYLTAQLRYFRSGTRNDKGSDIMKPIALHLTDAQMDEVSAYLSTL